MNCIVCLQQQQPMVDLSKENADIGDKDEDKRSKVIHYQ
jgi:hypothetical protein